MQKWKKWKLFSKKKTQPNSAVSVQDFYEYFSSLQSEVSTASNEESAFFVMSITL